MIEFNGKERILILAALKIEKEKLKKYNSDESTKDMFDEDLEDLQEIEDELCTDRILLSRNQLDTIGLYLAELHESGDFNQLEIIDLENRISALTDF